MNVFERALRAETYSNALEDPGTAVKNIASDPAFGLVAGLALGPAGYGLTSLQAAMAAGGISALATGSLQKGLMSGLSAYGGAGLSDSFMKAGASDLATKNVAALAESGANPIALTGGSGAEASALDKLSAGFGAATSSSDAALQFAKDNYGKALMAAGPILADQMVATKTPLPTAGSLSGPSYIRPYAMTRKVRQPEKDSGSREQDWFETTWERGTPYKAANGGIVALAGGGTTSQDAYDFLMGKKSNTGSLVNTVTQAPTFEGHYEFDTSTGTSRFVPARTDMTPAIKPVISTTTPSTTTTPTAGITTLVPGFGNPNAAAAQAAAFDAMTPAQKADHQAVMANLSEAMTPIAVKVLQQLKQKILFKNPNEPLAPVVNMDTVSPAAAADSVAVTSPVTAQTALSPTALSPIGEMGPTTPVAITSPVAPQSVVSPTAIGGVSSGSASSSGMGGMGTGAAGAAASGVSPGAAAAAANAAASAAVGNASSGSSGGSGSSSGSGSGSSGSGMGGMGTGAAGAAASAAAGGGGGGGGGGGCCFIMLEARYGDGTMDRVVRRYRDEKVTERNKRGYYKLAEVLIPLMRKSKLFSFLVVKTFADPAVCYAKWYYGENKWGWIFKPLERFWMGLFDTLGTETKFIRENGEVV